MKRIIALILALLTVSALAASCALRPEDTQPASSGETETNAETKTETAADKPAVPGPSNLENKLDGFDYDLMNYVEQKLGGQSYMISPLSFKYALGMLVAGADGQTLEQLKTAIGIDSVSELEDHIKSFNGFEGCFNEAVKKYAETYNSLPDEQKQYYDEPSGALRVANSIWKRNGIPDFLQGYKDAVSSYYAEYRDFALNSVIADVNAWANEKTEGMIPKLLPEDYDTSDLAVILMNALYYKNAWANEFTEAPDRDFTTVKNQTVKKKFISSTENYRYYSDEQTTLVAVPMKNGVDMIFILGSAENLTEKLSKAERRIVRVIIPEFEIETSLSDKQLVDFLKDRGAADAFSSKKADFSRMFDPDKETVYVDDIVQKAKIKLDKTGVEAAAVTAIMMKDECATEVTDPIEFVADKPFRFFIMTAKTEWAAEGMVMFEGRLAE